MQEVDDQVTGKVEFKLELDFSRSFPFTTAVWSEERSSPMKKLPAKHQLPFLISLLYLDMTTDRAQQTTNISKITAPIQICIA